MPTKREREYYAMGFKDGFESGNMGRREATQRWLDPERRTPLAIPKAPKRKLSAWQKYIKNKRNHIKYRDGKLNLKKMGVEFRRKKRR